MSETPDAGLRDDELDPDADPAMLPSPADTSDVTPSTGPADTLPVQEDPNDEDDPDADPGMLTSGR
jgi:hypothetical protein